MRTQLERVIRRAGLEPLPKLFQNLRSTRQTELEETFPSHVVCKWIGNSQKVAAKHYLQVTEEHFRKAAQIPAQSAHVRGGKAQEPGSENWEIPKEYDALPCLTMGQVARNGLEQPVAVAPTVHRGQVASDDREHGADQFRVA